MTGIGAQQREEIRKHGVVCLRGALDARALRMAQDAFEWSLANPTASAMRYTGGEGLFYQDLARRDAWTAYESVVRESAAADLVAGLWDARDVWFMYEQVFLKEGGVTRRTPWHQDASYLPIDGEQLAVMWISFDPVAAENSLEFVRGSHREVLYDGSSFDPADDTAPLYGDGTMPRLPDIEARRADFDIVSFAVEPGDVVVFHPAILHGGAATRPGTRRRTLSLRFFGNDATYAARPGMTQVVVGEAEATNVFQLLPATLSPGDPFRHPGFPKVRPR